MILASAFLVYLEIWALLTTGYTIGLLLTLFHCKRPVTDASWRRAIGRRSVNAIVFRGRAQS
jgi:hypothetical protein